MSINKSEWYKFGSNNITNSSKKADIYEASPNDDTTRRHRHQHHCSMTFGREFSPEEGFLYE